MTDGSRNMKIKIETLHKRLFIIWDTIKSKIETPVNKTLNQCSGNIQKYEILFDESPWGTGKGNEKQQNIYSLQNLAKTIK